jgi:nitrite reductase (NADH) small subunit/3-phenylpropionate/trans-cinnamate dioxygenase ferredoxin subunit
MNRFISIAKVDHVPPGTCVTAEVQGAVVALFNVEGTFYATDNTCPHAGGPLGEGTLVGNIVTCPWHGWRFNVCTGERPENPDFKVTSCEVRIEGDEVQIAVPITF